MMTIAGLYLVTISLQCLSSHEERTRIKSREGINIKSNICYTPISCPRERFPSQGTEFITIQDSITTITVIINDSNHKCFSHRFQDFLHQPIMSDNNSNKDNIRNQSLFHEKYSNIILLLNHFKFIPRFLL